MISCIIINLDKYFFFPFLISTRFIISTTMFIEKNKALAPGKIRTHD